MRFVQKLPLRPSVAAIFFVLLFASAASGECDSCGTVTINDAIKGRTEAVLLEKETAALDQDLRQSVRKIIADAEGQQIAGNVHLNKERYNEAVEAFEKAAVLYRKAIDGRKLLEQLSQTQQQTAVARMLAADADKDKLDQANRLEVNAKGLLDGGDIEQAIAEWDKARAIYDGLLPKREPATLEQAVAARTVMISTRAELPAHTRLSGKTQVRPGSLTDVLGQANNAQSAATDALEKGQYTPARDLFMHGEKLYRRAAVLQAQLDRMVAARDTAKQTMGMADNAYQTEARPASFERGKRALANGEQALTEEDLETAKSAFAAAAQQFEAARAEAEDYNAWAAAQKAWSTAYSGVDEDLLARHVAGAYKNAKATAQQARAKVAAGQIKAATDLFHQAVKALNNATADATTKENLAYAKPLIAGLKQAIAAKEKIKVEGLLSELEALIPADPRMARLRKAADALAWPAKHEIDLGHGVKIELVLIQPGSYIMGSESGGDIEKPAHQVTLSKPFYMGKTEFTQAQWQAVMGSNPSHFTDQPNNPVEQVSWDDCQILLGKLGEKVALAGKFRLPTEAEWEYACRADTTTQYSSGDGLAALKRVGWCSYDGKWGSAGKTKPVGSFRPNAWGLYDMHGNVWEWCSDWKGQYPSGAVTDPTGPADGSSRVLRGGSWVDDPRICRSATRYGDSLDVRDLNLGFRVVLDF